MKPRPMMAPQASEKTNNSIDGNARLERAPINSACPAASVGIISLRVTRLRRAPTRCAAGGSWRVGSLGMMGSSGRDIVCNYTGDGKTLTGVKQHGHYDNIAHYGRKTMAKLRYFAAQNWVILLPSFLFTFWALAFIYHSSYIASDGRLYFNLFDDAMISMRYAW